jgi:hypothetical protein
LQATRNLLTTSSATPRRPGWRHRVLASAAVGGCWGLLLATAGAQPPTPSVTETGDSWRGVVVESPGLSMAKPAPLEGRASPLAADAPRAAQIPREAEQVLHPQQQEEPTLLQNVGSEHAEVLCTQSRGKTLTDFLAQKRATPVSPKQAAETEPALPPPPTRTEVPAPSLPLQIKVVPDSIELTTDGAALAVKDTALPPLQVSGSAAHWEEQVQVQLLMEEQRLLQSFGPEHPYVLTVQARLRALTDYRARQRTVNAAEDQTSPLQAGGLPAHWEEQVQVQLLMEEQRLLQSFGPEHPHVLAVQARLRALIDYRARQRTASPPREPAPARAATVTPPPRAESHEWR